MWNLLRKAVPECRKLRDSLQSVADEHTGALSVQSVREQVTADERRHLDRCADCREAVAELVATKELFRGVPSFADEERPWFAARVMSAIASRERELAARVSAWTEFPRFASRLTVVALIALLAGTTWFYESVVRAPSYTSTGSQESIFEAPQPAAPDDTLVSKAGDVL